MTAPVTVLGEALIDIVVPLSGEVTEHVGGSPANVTVGLARLGHETTLVTHIGTDERGQRISGLLDNEGISLASGSKTAHHTPTATAHLDAAGVATYDFDLEWMVDPTALIAPGSHVHTGSIAVTLPPGAESVRKLVEAARPHSTVSYDPNARPSLMGDSAVARDTVEGMIALADVVKASDEDIAWLYPDASVAEVLHAWASIGPRLCVATQGGDAVIVLVAGELHEVGARKVPVADTVGAGDSF
ncbi:MAG TPA: PfkB family carbohydrate kinase, partial [Propionicimonas sp.]